MAGKRSGSKAKSAGGARRGKTKAKALKDLTVKNPRGGAIRGGRKAGKEQHEYLIVKMDDVIIT
jgi:hypothetical protein